MRTQPARSRVKAAVLALCGIAAIATTVGLASTAGATAAQPQRPGTASGVPVVVNCAMHAQTQPGQYILACADGNAYVAGLHWAAWGSSAAFATGSEAFNDCIPNCLAGHFLSFPVLVAAWRAEPWPGHAGVRYFTQMTLIYTGSLSYTVDGKVYHLPSTTTFPLSAYGGG